MFDVIGLGTVAMDVFLHVDELPIEDGFASVLKTDYLPGGSGTNVLTQISRLSGKCGYMAQISDDLVGREIKQSMIDEKIDINGLRIVQGATTLHCDIVVDKKGRKFILLNLGNVFDKWTGNDIDLEYFTKAKIFYTDLLPAGPAIEGLKQAKKNNMTTVFNLQMGMNTMKTLGASEQIIFDALEYVDIFAPCLGGFKQLCKTDDFEQAHNYIRNYFKKLLVCTLGDKGSISFEENEDSVFIPAYPADVIDTTGAGDSYLGAFIYSYLIDKKSLRESMKFATSCAAYTCEHVGARMCPNLSQAQQTLERFESKL